jgi:hypothetical protein
MIMAKKKRQQFGWVPAKPSKPSKPPDDLKKLVTDRAQELIEQSLRAKYIEEEPRNPQFNYVVDLFTKWRGRFFYFMAKFACPGENAISPFFEVGFARLEYVGDERFNLAYCRYTEEWWTDSENVTLDRALKEVANSALFHP